MDPTGRHRRVDIDRNRAGDRLHPVKESRCRLPETAVLQNELRPSTSGPPLAAHVPRNQGRVSRVLQWPLVRRA